MKIKLTNNQFKKSWKYICFKSRVKALQEAEDKILRSQYLMMGYKTNQ